MGNWSPYSEEWEKQHIRKIIKEAKTAYIEFEKKPGIYKVLCRLRQTIEYYLWFLAITIRKTFDRKYREEMYQTVSSMEEKTIKAIADLMIEEKKDDTDEGHLL